MSNDDENRIDNEEMILLSLIQGEEGRSWAEKRRGWIQDSGVKICDWDGILCNDDGEKRSVKGILLGKADLLATLPSELGLLASLERLELNQNLIRGTIPEQIFNHKHLVTFNLQENQLQGTVPNFKSTHLNRLDLSHNRFVGRLHPDFAVSNKQLHFIDLQHNFLTGFIPFGIEDLPNLETVSISHNRLSGTLPNYLGAMSALKYLYLDHNNIVGTIPHTFGTLQSAQLLSELWLQNNMLSGTIPHTLANATKLADLYLDGNYLTGGVPKPLCKDNLNADFFQNLPASDTKQRDLCDSVTCPANTVSLEGVYPCTPCPSTIPHPYMGNTQKCQDLTQDKIIAALFGLNPDSSSKSACKYKGVECDENGYVIKIYAAGKALSGTLPEQIGFLDHLRELDISNNHFNGFLPSSLRFPPIQVLKLGGNQFSGIITPLLCLKQNINGNGQNGPLTCNSIACPIGTYSVNAYGYGECLNCPDGAPFIGSTLCSPNAIPPRHRSSDNGVHGTSVAIVVLSVVATVSIIVVYLRHRQQQFLATHEYSDGKAFQPSGGESSLPHPDEAKSTFQRYREHIQERRRSSGGNWIQKRLKKSYHYVISLTETENVPGKRYVGGQIDDFGWKERESILHHRDLENCVKAQQQNGIKTSVWEYPDPLESVSSYKTDSFEEEEEDGDDDDYDDTLGDDDDDDDDLHEWIKKQQSDPATRDVWLDVPRVE